MNRLKTFAKYILWLVLFFVFSRVLIFIGLNNTYESINIKGDIPQGVSISSAKATPVNGEIKGNISDEIKSTYVKFNFYTNIDTLAGSYYITPSELENNNFEFYFKLDYIESYSLEFTDEKPEQTDLESFSTKEFKGYLILSALITLMFI